MLLLTSFLQNTFSHIASAIVALFLSVLFLQSGFDKVFDFQGNLGYLKSHFAKSPLKNLVPLLLFALTFFEVASGLVSLAGIIVIGIYDTTFVAWSGAILSAITLVMLFFGQRMAKDYAGAASLVPYFVVSILGMMV